MNNKRDEWDCDGWKPLRIEIQWIAMDKKHLSQLLLATLNYLDDFSILVRVMSTNPSHPACKWLAPHIVV